MAGARATQQVERQLAEVRCTLSCIAPAAGASKDASSRENGFFSEREFHSSSVGPAGGSRTNTTMKLAEDEGASMPTTRQRAVVEELRKAALLRERGDLLIQDTTRLAEAKQCFEKASLCKLLLPGTCALAAAGWHVRASARLYHRRAVRLTARHAGTCDRAALPGG